MCFYIFFVVHPSFLTSKNFSLLLKSCLTIGGLLEGRPISSTSAANDLLAACQKNRWRLHTTCSNDDVFKEKSRFSMAILMEYTDKKNFYSANCNYL